MTLASLTLVSFFYLKRVIFISKTHRERQSKIKVKKILDAARQVFCRKGFVAVTMQDIIDECGISRGGIYLYFASVDEIFLEVMKHRNKERFSEVNTAVQGLEPFGKVLADYFARQKERLLNFENSLFRAYCEYIFSKPKPAVQAFRDIQFAQLQRTIVSILQLGVGDNKKIHRLANHFIVVIDGLSVLALAEALTEDLIDGQFEILKELIQKENENAD
ncbi:MAG: TetR/AcrR family transcriptional regulator [Defluviitaleaceae bacterium]|nr:TetR/AcrR family transcriptional regulator [Defluviitaleaceae bacterium]MCL2261734.1 TetR/AcrR family transcriptional regulator [Defluviitaleaceae bacterium]